MTLKQIDELHRRPDGTAGRQFRQHKARFVPERDFFSVDRSSWSDEIRRTIEGPSGRGGHKGALLLFTERGYGKIVKGWKDEHAWPSCPLTGNPTVVHLVRFCFQKMEAEMSNPNHQSRERVPVSLPGARVLPEFRDRLFDAANKAGVTPNEYALRAVAEKLGSRGHQLAGIFEVGDIDEVRI